MKKTIKSVIDAVNLIVSGSKKLERMLEENNRLSSAEALGLISSKKVVFRQDLSKSDKYIYQVKKDDFESISEWIYYVENLVSDTMRIHLQASENKYFAVFTLKKGVK